MESGNCMSITISGSLFIDCAIRVPATSFESIAGVMSNGDLIPCV
jgi:hypothetical protein